MREPVAGDLARARRLEWWTIGWLASIVAIMTSAAGGSQAFRTALFEDLLSLVPAIVFLVAARMEGRAPTRAFPFGYDRVQSLAFLIAAVALVSVGGVLAVEAVKTLIAAARPSLLPVSLFGTPVWSGWVMVAALAYSVVPPFILGRMKLPIARRLQDKVLHTDAMMQKADWMTGIAGIAGIVGIGFGLWWADAAAALAIALSVLHDGLKAIRSAAAELVDGAPRALASDEIAEDAEHVRRSLERAFPGAEVRLREVGRFIRAEVVGVPPPAAFDVGAAAAGLKREWRLAAVTFIPPAG